MRYDIYIYIYIYIYMSLGFKRLNKNTNEEYCNNYDLIHCMLSTLHYILPNNFIF